MTFSQVGGAAGRWNGPGRVYEMMYSENENNYYKIGCAKDPNTRLQEIQKHEGNYNISLINSVKANQMNGAETAAQNAAVSRLGLVKDPSRGGATDWFMGAATPEQVLGAIRPAVYTHNARNKNP